ncbi:LCP family protein [Selenomonas sp. TAMA-11512]|uniref:LCP family protein n=1 Tax=Selenomonas sp. TAMA-11512 TaxID=3095337 RepID=UPI00308D4EAD|nr:LCP family protein [Selenomonas sp. TAMA-11512]
MDKNESIAKRRERRRPVKRSYKRVILLGIVLLAGVIAAAAALFMEQEENVTDKKIVGSQEERILVLGVDRREGDAGRSDTMMVLTVDKAARKASLLSLPRDTRVEIQGFGYDKLNAAYAHGGKTLAKETVENLLDAPIQRMLIIDVHAFQRIIDTLGGVELDVEKRMYYEDPWDDNGGLVIDIEPGFQHLDGETAIGYVRYRDEEGDIGRIMRQQRFIAAMLNSIATPATIAKLPDIFRELSSVIDTDITTAEAIELFPLIQDIRQNGLTAEMAPGRPYWHDGVSYWVPDILALREMVAKDSGVELKGELLLRAEALVDKYMAELPREDGDPLMEKAKASAEASNDEKDGEAKDGETDGESAESEENDLSPKGRIVPVLPEDITVTIINSSGITGAGARTAALLEAKGFKIGDVTTGRMSDRAQTTIMAEQRSIVLFYGMPFPCIIMEGADKNEAVVNIGVDFKKYFANEGLETKRGEGAE